MQSAVQSAVQTVQTARVQPEQPSSSRPRLPALYPYPHPYPYPYP